MDIMYAYGIIMVNNIFMYCHNIDHTIYKKVAKFQNGLGYIPTLLSLSINTEVLRVIVQFIPCVVFTKISLYIQDQD